MSDQPAGSMSRGTRIIKRLRSYCSARVSPVQSNLAIIITQLMVSINVKTEIYFQRENSAVYDNLLT